MVIIINYVWYKFGKVFVRKTGNSNIIIIRSIKVIDGHADVIVVGESWLNKNLFEFYEIFGFKAFFCGRDSGSRGGGDLYILRII